MNIIPFPKKLELTDGLLPVKGIEIVMNSECDSRIFAACRVLAAEIESHTGLHSKVGKSFSPLSCGVCISVCAGKDEDSESYTLDCDENGVRISAPSLAGAFYGIQTLRQIIMTEPGAVPFCHIEDSPDMRSRGFYHDISRGRVPTVEGVKKLIDRLSLYKINTLQLYIEHAYDFRQYRVFLTPYGYMTAEEIMELDDYCYEHFIDFVPSLSTFGHLYHLLNSPEYKHLCELEDYKPHPNFWINRMLHHTIDASNPESFELVASIIDQYIPLFRSKYFNICCDETFDLCTGRNKGKDKAALYLEFTTKLINHVASRGKTVMMWGDIALNHPEILSSFPKDMIMLCWDYRDNPDIGNIAKFAENGLPQIVCPGCSCWNHFCEVTDYAKKNIVAMIEGGVKNGALGVLNTSWGDYGHVCSLNCTLYGLTLGAAKSWNVSTDVYSDEYELAVSELVYGDPTGITVSLIRSLGECEQIMSWGLFTQWHFGEHNYYGVEREMTADDAPKFIANAERCFALARSLGNIGADEIYTDLVLSAQATGYLNYGFARMIGGGDFCSKSEFLLWCERYEQSWLRDNKVSDLYLIPELIKKVLFD